jgi:hypothetical protein
MYLNYTNEWIYEEQGVFDNRLHYSCVTTDVKKKKKTLGVGKELGWYHAASICLFTLIHMLLQKLICTYIWKEIRFEN